MRKTIFQLSVCLSVACLFPIRPSASTDQFERITAAEANFPEKRLKELEGYLEENGSSSLILIRDGRIFYEFGDIYQKHLVHSIRKALLHSIFGIYVDKGLIDLEDTLADLRIDDCIPRLSDAEKAATIGDLLRSKSGVYHEAAAESTGMAASRPKRGNASPGENFYYNNWDFNVLGHIFEQSTGYSIYEAFDKEIAKPLGMLHYNGDFTVIDGDREIINIPDTDGFYRYERSKSVYPAYHFRMSSHDLALYGCLYLNWGMWKGKQIVPRTWIEESIAEYSVMNRHMAYGRLWNVSPPTEYSAISFSHSGRGIHMLGIYPASKLVLVHRVDTENPTDFSNRKLVKILSIIFGFHYDE